MKCKGAAIERVVPPHVEAAKPMIAGWYWIALAFAVSVAACTRYREAPRAPFVPITVLESQYGHLITAGNHPTGDQRGSGDRIGLFRDRDGTIWGLPLMITTNGAVFVCVPPGLHHAKVTDTYPADAIVIGATNQPTGHREGTGKLELVMRGPNDETKLLGVNAGEMANEAVCWSRNMPLDARPLHYYRLAPSAPINR